MDEFYSKYLEENNINNGKIKFVNYYYNKVEY